jgi:hypothetical protein
VAALPPLERRSFCELPKLAVFWMPSQPEILYFTFIDKQGKGNYFTTDAEIKKAP